MLLSNLLNLLYSFQMSKVPQQFDLLVVLDERSAKSAANASYYEPAPFPDASTYFRSNASYEYFLKYCKSVGLKAAFSTTTDITGPGLFSSYWIFTNKWQRVLKSAHTSFIFDKFSATDHRNTGAAKLLLSAKKPVRLFHRQEIRTIFDNKLNTHNHFPTQTIPTVAISLHSQSAVTRAKQHLRNTIAAHKNPNDFSKTFMVKDQFGSGGANIYKVNNNKNLTQLYNNHRDINFILQPFIETSESRFENFVGRIDTRVMLLNGKIVQSFIRIAKPGEYRANAYRGGTLIYIPLDRVPEPVVHLAMDMKKILTVKDTLFALDFIRSNAGNYYLVEGNSMPGLNWFVPENAKHARKLMRLIIHSIQKELLQNQ